MIELTCYDKACDGFCPACMRKRASRKPEPPPHQRRIPDPVKFPRGKAPKEHKKLIKKNSAVRVRIERPIANKETNETIPHGTERGYSKHRCRCQPCKDAYRVKSAERYAMNKPNSRKFDEARKKRLAANRLRPEWQNASDDEMLELTRLAAIKLENSVVTRGPKILEDAADLSNYAYILYDRTIKTKEAK